MAKFCGRPLWMALMRLWRIFVKVILNNCDDMYLVYILNNIKY